MLTLLSGIKNEHDYKRPLEPRDTGNYFIANLKNVPGILLSQRRKIRSEVIVFLSQLGAFAKKYYI
jgi:hypothetical protein